jgi:hypothetical protein
MSDIRNTQEIFTDLFGGLTDLGARGVDALIIGRAIARLLIQKGILSEDEVVETMRDVLTQEVEKKTESPFVLETYKNILEKLNADRADE